MADGFVRKVCPVVIRQSLGGERSILAFRHPFAGAQLVKGTLEPGEAVHAGALRELDEESGIATGRVVADLGSSSTIDRDQLWHFVLVETGQLPDRWTHLTADDGGHVFDFFWHRLEADPDASWHYIFGAALGHIRSALDAPHNGTR